jgi:hypothetical protein
MIERQLLSWARFTRVERPAPGQLVAHNGFPIVASVEITINFNDSPVANDGANVRFDPPHVSFNLWQANYVPSRFQASQRDYYLRHEQGHMDLMCLLARELEVKLTKLRTPGQRFMQTARQIVNQAVSDSRLVAINTRLGDCRYDIETNHGMNRQAQGRWNRHIQQELARMADPNYEFRSPD